MEDNLVLCASGIDFSYHQSLVLEGVNLDLRVGDLLGLIGPNGSGKTTLLKVLSGLLTPQRGWVRLFGQDLRDLTRREIAKAIAVVPQELEVPYAFTAQEMVMMGRTPHVRPLLGAGQHDRELVGRAIKQVGIDDLATRPFQELSGGERQRVIIAMALAQEPRVLLLDEPTVHLDINHQVEVLELLRRLNREAGITVLATMHDLNLAALFFERLVLLNRGEVVAEGPPEDVLGEDLVRRVFGADVRVERHPTVDVPHMVLLPPNRPLDKRSP